mmetsp:Transcript_65203/g.147063  ORF Transcript_65203/g.147063 Transcript_65203/m.147063 type:complete len:80 (-) Transcript_65203:21-260(-)
MRVAHSNTRLLSPPFFGGACVLPCCTGDGVVGLHPVLREGGFRPDRQRGHGGGGGYVSLTTMGAKRRKLSPTLRLSLFT